MTVLQGVLAGAGLAAAILAGVWRMIEALRRENREAHARITKRIDRVEDGIGQKLDRVAHDVAYLAGRQAERDQNR
jgi:hypothetical protein